MYIYAPIRIPPMLSICIPIYNQDITRLANTLSKQAAGLDIPVELVLLDDESLQDTKEINRKITALPFVKYEELVVNTGRSRIRNLLAQKAAYPYLLFLDCDTAVVSDCFLQNYLTSLQAGTVTCGGHIYADKQPAGQAYHLHWLAGSKREVKPAKLRQQQPYKSFMTGNFLIDRSVFEKVRFREDLMGYGHEDTLFGYELMKRSIRVNHIDNPIMHLGLKSADDFLGKTRESLQNLLITYDLVQRDPDYTRIVKILRTYLMIKRLGLNHFFKRLSGILEKPMEKHLKGKNPGLWVFDLYKLCILCRLPEKIPGKN